MDIKTAPEKFQNWVPVRIYWHDSQPFVDWCYVGTERFTEPFFDNSIEKIIHQKPFTLLFQKQTTLEFLGELEQRNPGLAPNGFIFHMSRCGSTLVSQMLTALPKNIVISEPVPVDLVLRANSKESSVTDEQRITWLKWIVSAFGQKRNPEECRYFIKFDSWSTLNLDLIRRAFPGVPWIFLYRNPVEVIVSHMRIRGAQMIPGIIDQMLPDVELPEILRMPAEEYCARVMAQFCENALKHSANKTAMMIDYDQLPGAVTTAMLEHFGVEYSAEEIELMKNAARFNAKQPHLEFAPDSETKKREAGEAALQAAEKWANPLFEQLKKLSVNL